MKFNDNNKLMNKNKLVFKEKKIIIYVVIKLDKQKIIYNWLNESTTK